MAAAAAAAAATVAVRLPLSTLSLSSSTHSCRCLHRCAGTSRYRPLRLSRPSSSRLRQQQHGQQHNQRRRRGVRVLASLWKDDGEHLEGVDDKFRKIDTQSDARFGPEAVLLVGFNKEHARKFEAMLSDIDAGFLKVLVCTRAMLNGTLMEALLSAPSDTSEPAQGLPKILFMSGLSGAEVMELVASYQDDAYGLPSTIFAAAVPKNADTNMRELMEEIVGDHESMKERRREMNQAA